MAGKGCDDFRKILAQGWLTASNGKLDQRAGFSGEGFDFEPGLKIAHLTRKGRLHLGIEYYGSTGPLTGFHRLDDQVHLLFPSADIFFNDLTMLNLGVGFGLTPAGERLILKSRLGWRF
jgi:hypothetical protein